MVPVLEDYMKRMMMAGYNETYRHDVLTSATNIYDKKVQDDKDGICPLNRPPEYKRAERQEQKRNKKRNWSGRGIPIIIPATEGSKLAKEMRKVSENIARENPNISFRIIERGGVSLERTLMKSNPTESIHCGRECFSCNQVGENRNMCRKSNITYYWECNEKDVCPDTGYDGQSSKNNLTRSGQHIANYNNWVKSDNEGVNPRTGRTRRQPTNNSFLFDHQKEKHNSAPPNFKLRTKRYYGSDRLACQVAEAVSLKMRTGEILNSKTDFSAPPLVTIRKEISRGLGS